MGRRADHDDEATRRLLASIEETEDTRTAWGEIRRRIDKLQSSGERVPEALVATERHLMREFMAESQGR